MVTKKNYGIMRYDEKQLSLHKDIMKLMKSEKHREISADDCMIVFARIYSTYVVSQLKKEGVLNINEAEK